MGRVTYYPTVDGGQVRHVCAMPGPRPLPDALRKVNVTLRLTGETLQRVDAAALAADETRQQWIERRVLDGLRMA